MTVDSAQAWYVYGVLPAGTAAPPVEGVLPGVPVEAMRLGGVSVLVSVVPRMLFDSSSALHRTADPDWMAERIEAHHAVAAAAIATGPCLPLLFGSLFSSVAMIRQWLSPRATALQAALERVSGQTEWTVSLQEDAAEHETWLERHDPKLSALKQATDAAPPGTAFLLSRQLEKARSTARSAHLEAASDRVTDLLSRTGLTVLAQGNRAGMPNWTLLASGAGALWDMIGGTEAELQAMGLSLGLSGPWPAYAFARSVLKETEHAG